MVVFEQAKEDACNHRIRSGEWDGREEKSSFSSTKKT